MNKKESQPTKADQNSDATAAPCASVCSCGAVKDYREVETLGEALSVMLTELSDAKEACKRMAAKQSDEGMRLYHEGQADAYLMVKRGVERQLAKLPQTQDCRSVGPF